ncbi:MAG: NAD-dependent deacylase [bacterium]|nr:NAD-dependent deacylase [bacterium]
MLEELASIIQQSRAGVVLTGAGMSAESGVPTFRGNEGLWAKFRPEDLATMNAFIANSKLVWEWYNWRRDLIRQVQSNAGHYALVELAGWFPSFTLVTQNVDNLHRMAGSDHVLEIHGNILRNKCADCNRPIELENEIEPSAIPKCPACGGKIRPDVVWFGEMLPEETIQAAFDAAEAADIFFSIGTSALVHPAATLPVVAKRHGAILVEINPDETPLTSLADYYFPAKSGEILPQLVEKLSQVGRVQ